MRRTAEDVIEIDGRSALHGIRRAFPLHPRRVRSRCRPASASRLARAAERCTAAVTVDRSGGRALVFARQVFQHGIAGVLGLGEGFERRATDPDRATALVKPTP
jgi:hypothetical protein